MNSMIISIRRARSQSICNALTHNNIKKAQTYTMSEKEKARAYRFPAYIDSHAFPIFFFPKIFL